ncbi:hypothetical protein MXAN_0973 [Myxococcus xanthus DK 1622]|uniref:Uncharacterized protein n=1 Tax=Myxococcus xanthus (strain DK1622) TaxID=246197 RepID=Q1DDN9_MYXXD|nr:hypothetical protein MXAN_0973 [Myxococcus xanthus DK 1622]
MPPGQRIRRVTRARRSTGNTVAAVNGAGAEQVDGTTEVLSHRSGREPSGFGRLDCSGSPCSSNRIVWTPWRSDSRLSGHRARRRPLLMLRTK